MKYRGEMKTSFLNDRQIQPSEFRKWEHARRQFARRGRDQETVDKYKEQIRQGGLKEPILLGVDDRDLFVRVSDGHHRAVALMELGIEKFPFHWCLIKAWSTPVQNGPFPYQLLEASAHKAPAKKSWSWW
jgi:hypothetical protein